MTYNFLPAEKRLERCQQLIDLYDIDKNFPENFGEDVQNLDSSELC